MVLPGGGLQADVPEAISGIVRFLGHGRKPTVGIVGLNEIQSQNRQIFRQFGIVTHQPNHQVITGLHMLVHHGMLHVPELTLCLGKSIIDLRMLPCIRIDFTGAYGKFDLPSPLFGSR